MKTSEDEHRFLYLDPMLKPIFSRPYKCYELKLNKSVNGTHKRPDFTCNVDQLPILNSEVKPTGFTTLQKNKGFIKVNYRAKKTINDLLNKRGGPNKAVFFINMGIYFLL